MVDKASSIIYRWTLFWSCNYTILSDILSIDLRFYNEPEDRCILQESKCLGIVLSSDCKFVARPHHWELVCIKPNYQDCLGLQLSTKDEATL